MKRWWAVLALLGCLFQATVLPIHASIRAAQAHTAAWLNGELGVICHKGDAPASPAQQAPPGEQPQPSDDCPICKSTAAFQLAVLAFAELGLLETPSSELFACSANERSADSRPSDPRSRGPPTRL